MSEKKEKGEIAKVYLWKKKNHKTELGEGSREGSHWGCYLTQTNKLKIEKKKRKRNYHPSSDIEFQLQTKFVPIKKFNSLVWLLENRWLDLYLLLFIGYFEN